MRSVHARRTRAGVFTIATLLHGCSNRPQPAPNASPSATASAIAPEPSQFQTPSAAAAPRAQIDGHDFPERVLALTWDDGPDAHTLELARHLHEEHVSATFFVVKSWVDGVSSDPGEGSNVFHTGFDALPILGELVKLGHRIGNHTAHHVLLASAERDVVVRELRENQAAIAPFIGQKERMFRVPGGAWSDAASLALDSTPELTTMVGPFRWDIDGKDWDGSLACRSQSPEIECDKAGPRDSHRMRPAAVVARYLAQIERAPRGIVLLHDRVGHVGSRYALDVARPLVAALKAKSYVFAAPLLRFSAPASTRLAGGPLRESAKGMGDVNGDGRPDRCSLEDEGIECSFATAAGFEPPRRFTLAGHLTRSNANRLELGDLNGDGRADACVRTTQGVVCALSAGERFTEERLWLDRSAPGASELIDAEAARLTDADGDARADFCLPAEAFALCAFAP